MEAAKERLERLKALKEAKTLIINDKQKFESNQEKEQIDKEVEVEVEEDKNKPILKFRNYELRDGRIEHIQAEQAKAPEIDANQILNKRKREEEGGENEEPMSELVPKQVNWDLKRGVEKRLKILEKRTHRALMELMQEEEKRRLEEAGGIADAEDEEIIEKLDDDEKNKV